MTEPDFRKLAANACTYPVDHLHVFNPALLPQVEAFGRDCYRAGLLRASELCEPFGTASARNFFMTYAEIGEGTPDDYGLFVLYFKDLAQAIRAEAGECEK